MDRKLRFRNLATKEGPLVVVRMRKPLRAVYFQVADRPIPYKHGKNRIIYVGSTQATSSRSLTSLADVVPYRSRIPGLHRIEVHIIECELRQGVKSWRVLERACLIIFRERYGELPWLNSQGSKMEPGTEFKLLDRSQVRRLIRGYEGSG
jgi:hypothetical protein